MKLEKSDPELSIVLTIVSGRDAVRGSLLALVPQLDFGIHELIVPYDKFSAEIEELIPEFPQVTFYSIGDLGLAASPAVSCHAHRLYDRRRAVGLRLARGRLIAMLEDHGRVAEDWVAKTVAAHRLNYAAIGGAIENGIDKPLNLAVYYCDFGRYGKPFEAREVDYISDINISYKREALDATGHVWAEAYHETAVHQELARLGFKLFLDDGPVVYQRRAGLRFVPVLVERVQWGRIFAETRSKDFPAWKRIGYCAGSFLLPPVMAVRVFRHMLRQKVSAINVTSTIPALAMLLTCWAAGEFAGYLAGEPLQSEAASESIRPTTAVAP
jgi:hypothetical protein